MEKPDLPSPTALSFPDLAEPPAARSLANKRLLQSREKLVAPKHSPCGSHSASACWPRSRIA